MNWCKINAVHDIELSSTMSWVGCLLKDSELFILFAANSQILLKISVIPILLTFIYLVALNLLVNNQLQLIIQLNLSLQHTIITLDFWQEKDIFNQLKLDKKKHIK